MTNDGGTVGCRAAGAGCTGTGQSVRSAAGHHHDPGGLQIFSQILTLYTTPVIYLYFDRLARFFGKSRAKGATRAVSRARQ